jgi:TonB family protein
MEELRMSAAYPFLLEATIKARFGKGTVNGQYAISWWAANRWREVLSLADFQRVRDGVGGGYRQVRSWDYQPQVIFDIDKMFDVSSILELSPKETAKKVRKRKIGGVELPCIEIASKVRSTRDLCFDPATDVLVHADLSPINTIVGTRFTVDYSAFVPLGERKFPSKLILTRPDGFSMEVAINRLEAISGVSSPAPTADPHSEFWQACEGGIPAELINQAPPTYPSDSKQKHEQGIVSVYARIESDGTISHLESLQSPSASLEQATLQAVGRWKYSPRSCQHYQ